MQHSSEDQVKRGQQKRMMEMKRVLRRQHKGAFEEEVSWREEVSGGIKGKGG